MKVYVKTGPGEVVEFSNVYSYTTSGGFLEVYPPSNTAPSYGYPSHKIYQYVAVPDGAVDDQPIAVRHLSQFPPFPEKMNS